MNTQFEFLGYEAVEGEKFLGIATIRAWGKIILKYKVTPGKDGHGFFCSEASIKNGIDISTGKDNFERCWMLESNYENELLKKFLKAHVNPYENAKPSAFAQPVQQSASVFQTFTPSQPNATVSGGSAIQPQSKVSDDEYPF